MITTQPRRTRRTHSEAFKQSLIEACGEPGASVAGFALAEEDSVTDQRLDHDQWAQRPDAAAGSRNSFFA